MSRSRVPVTRRTRQASTRLAIRACSGHDRQLRRATAGHDQVGPPVQRPAAASALSSAGSIEASQSQNATTSAVAASSPAWQAAP